jgi:hypothetical protein
MGHQYNHGLVTSMKGPAIEAFRLTGMNVAACTIEDQCKSGLVASAAILTGVVTVQFSLPYPPAIVACTVSYSSLSALDDIITARPRLNGYNAATGQLIIDLSNDDDVTSPAAATPAASDELNVIAVFRRYTA